jgi:hypothetical protein
MAITSHLAGIILAEHKHKPIEKKILLIGRQSVFLTVAKAKSLVSDAGIFLNKNRCEKCDSETRDRNDKFIEDKSFFSLFTDASVDVMDVSEYEGANIIHDLQKPIGREYYNQYDFIYNGSCLDNIFDPVQSNKNISLMLKDGGRVLHYESGTAFFGSYLMFSPDWFFDYYAINNFFDCKVYLCTWEDSFHDNFWSIYQYQPFHNLTPDGAWLSTPPFRTNKQVTVVALAEKGKNSTIDQLPLQRGYRPSDQLYLDKVKDYALNNRKLDFIDMPAKEFNSSKGISLFKKLSNLINHKQKYFPEPNNNPGFKLLGCVK